jgi:hypothetical protein
MSLHGLAPTLRVGLAFALGCLLIVALAMACSRKTVGSYCNISFTVSDASCRCAMTRTA